MQTQFEKIAEGILQKGLEVYVKETAYIYADEFRESIVRKEDRIVKSRIIDWEVDFINPEVSKKADLFVIYRKVGTNLLARTSIDFIFLAKRTPHCWKCKRSLDQNSMDICPKCEGIICPHDGACHYTCFTKN